MDGDERCCVVCGEDVLGRDFVQVDGAIIFAMAGERGDQDFLAREDMDEDKAEYFCRGCLPKFEEMMWVQVDMQRGASA